MCELASGPAEIPSLRVHFACPQLLVFMDVKETGSFCVVAAGRTDAVVMEGA